MSLVTVVKHALPYFADSALLFAPWAKQAWAMFLDSAYRQGNTSGRFDIIACEPVCTLLTFGDTTLINQGGKDSFSLEDPFKLIKQHLGTTLASLDDLPFNGGAIGYFAYDLARRIEKIPIIAQDQEQIPDLAIGIYHWAVIVDHLKQQSWLVTRDLSFDESERLIHAFSHLPEIIATDFQVLQAPQANMDKTAYSAAFEKIKAYLTEGDCYQVNLTQRFASPCQGDPWQAYQTLRQINAAPFSAYLHVPNAQVLSSSPERFLRVAQQQVETKPIKGTRPRKTDNHADEQQKTDLANSSKDRAENVMIVDLLRNDLSKTCLDGSVQVPTLFAVETYATVHHLVSTVQGELAPELHALDLLRSCFPGGSITGAPKIRAMEIIEELEPHRRGLYCGAIAYISFDGNMDSNITIRTLVHNQNSIRFWVGGGIVNDSQLDEEYQECFDKAQALLQLLEQFHH